MEGEIHQKKVARLEKKKTIEEGAQDALDPEVWGELLEHIPLELIHEKLSQQVLMRLRFVSKEWNHLALQRLLPKPYFITITSGYESLLEEINATYLNGILTYDVASGHCKFQHQRSRLPYVDSHVAPFEVEGLILCHNPDNWKQRGVFNAHTQTWHVIPPAPKQSEFRSACGLIVDTTLKPYTFKLVQGSTDIKTQIYDSKTRSWSTTSSSVLSQAAASQFTEDDTSYSCICHNGEIYISLNMAIILKYSMEEDTWTTIEFPEMYPHGRRFHDLGFYIGQHNTMGVWEGRVFATTEDCYERPLSAWELVDPQKGEWVEYARMSKKQYNWLYENDTVSHSVALAACASKRLFSCFGDGYLLVGCWLWNHARADALVLLNLRKKKWKQVDLPMGTVATYDPEFTYAGIEPPKDWWSDGGSSSDEDTDSADETEDFDTEHW